MKKILIIPAILLVLLGAVEFYVQTDQFAAMIRPFVVAPLKQVLGNDANIGWVRANFIPPYVEARDISLPDARRRHSIAVHKIKVYINPLPLVFKTIRLPSVVVLEPRVEVQRDRDGAVNLEPVLERISGNIARLQKEPSSGYEVSLKSISAVQGVITLRDDVTGLKATVSNVNITTRMNRVRDDVSVRIRKTGVHASAPAYPELAGELNASVRYDKGRVHIEDLDFTTGDTTLSLTGKLGALPDPDLDLLFKARTGPQTMGKLMGLLKRTRKERVSHMEASATVRGTVSAPQIAGSFQLAGLAYEGLVLNNASIGFGYRDRTLTVSGQKLKLSRGQKTLTVDTVDASIGFANGGMDIRRFEAQAGDLAVAVSGRADLQHGYDAVLKIESRDRSRTLSFLTTAPLEGPLQLSGSLSGAMNSPVLDGSFSAGPLTVRGILFDSASGKIQYKAKKVSILSADIRQRASRYAFSGSADWTRADVMFEARLKANHSDVGSIVALFYQPLPLHFAATGELSFAGTARDFTGNGRLTVDAGDAYGESFTKGTVIATLSKDRIAFPEVIVDKGSGRVEGTGWIGFDGTYGASVESHGVRLSEVDLLAGKPLDGAFDLSIDSSGSFSRPQVRAALEMDELQLNQTALGGMNADLQIQGGIMTCTASLASGHAAFGGRMTLAAPYAWSAQASLSAEDVDPLLVLGRKELTGGVRMTFAGALSVHGRAGDTSALTGTATFNRMTVSVGDYRIENEEPAVLSLRGDRVSVTTLKMRGQATRLSVTGSARLMKDLDLSFLGTANLSLLRPLIRELEYTNGTAEVKLAVRDSWNNPDITGQLAVRDGEIKVRDIPQKFSAVSGKLRFDRNTMVIESLAGEMGGGTLNASGNAELNGLAISNFSTRMGFQNVTVRYPEGLVTTLSGNLTFDGDGSDQYLGGDVAIKRARYDKRVEWKSMLVDIGKGLYQKKKTETGWIGDTQLNVRFSGKDNILFQNNLAKVPLDVDMFLRGTVNHPQLMGRVEARKGSVYFRQNEFKIVHASADFVDPNRMNPVIDVQAEIQIREYLVRLAVSGTADRAVVTLLADPQLSDSDILTLLALGKKGDELKGKEAGVGMSEAASFATGQFQDIFESRARSLTGLDRFQIDPYVSKTDTSVPRVTVGKEIIQDKFYVTYSSNVGAATPDQVFRIEYILDRHFSLVGERNDMGNTGADIKYRFEFR